MLRHALDARLQPRNWILRAMQRLQLDRVLRLDARLQHHNEHLRAMHPLQHECVHRAKFKYVRH